ncbi:MAG: hypothetical protein LUF30_13035, partial [Lachnospiraceae bacterium]|nr:hypothetical protein [Lachnospiraceae bacterium]
MIKIDLITGFLGAGKTTFIKKYAEYMIRQGMNIGILENDYGAVNVDMMLLQDLEGEQCELEMVAGGCHRDCHRRRFKSKLIAMGMSGYDRVLVEPSGIYDVDEFFDVLQEEPLDQWYEIGNVIAIVDAKLESDLSAEVDYLLASEVANAGCVVMSKSQEATAEEIRETIAHLNRALEAVKCERRFWDGQDAPVDVAAICPTRGELNSALIGANRISTGCSAIQRNAPVIHRDWANFGGADFERIASCGYVTESYHKMSEDEEGFQSVYFMNVRMSGQELSEAASAILADTACGNVIRIQGVLRMHETRE